MEFSVEKEKAVEALVYVAKKFPGVGRFHACKILYFAERFHVRAYGRPIFGDRYYAMENGPVPSFAYDVLKDEMAPSDRGLAEGALIQSNSARHPAYNAGREPHLEYFSASDLECLDKAINHCARRSFGSISDETHHHKAWAEAGLNAPMAWDDFFDDVEPDVIEDAKVFAAYGVL